jgi:ABC-type multidrug transport system fused ATPase/permease subunit
MVDTGTGLIDTSTPGPSLRVLLMGLGGRHRFKLALTYALTLIENGLNVLYPYLTGVAIDALLAGRWMGVAPLLIAWTVHLGVGLFRHVYDTRVFTLVYADLAGDLVERQRAQGENPAYLVARVTLSREIVDFLQVEVPSVTASVVRCFGAIAMLFVLTPWVAALALVALIPTSLFTLWFGRVSLRLNAALNDRLEREVELVSRGSERGVRRHFAYRLRFWRVRISDAEAKVWGAIEVVHIALTLATLALLAREGSGATAGAIYAALSYVWTYGESVNDLPAVIQKISRLNDIASRLG